MYDVSANLVQDLVHVLVEVVVAVVVVVVVMVLMGVVVVLSELDRWFWWRCCCCFGGRIGNINIKHAQPIVSFHIYKGTSYPSDTDAPPALPSLLSHAHLPWNIPSRDD